MSEQILNDTISGFSDISTCRFEGFTTRNLSDFEVILSTIENSDKYQKMIGLFEKIRKHMLATNDAHIFTLEGMESEVIACLYKQYRKLGYKGTASDMLKAVIKTIKVADATTVSAGISDTEAEEVISVSRMMKEHYTKPYAHREINEIFAPPTCLNVYPYVTIDSLSDSTRTSYLVDNIINKGAIYFELWYNRNRDQGLLFDVTFDEGTLGVEAHTNGISVLLDGVLIDTLPYPDLLTINKYVLSMDRSGIVLRDEISKFVKSGVILNNATNLVFSNSAIPIGNGSRNCGDGINKLYVYDFVPSDEEQTYLLN